MIAIFPVDEIVFVYTQRQLYRVQCRLNVRRHSEMAVWILIACEMFETLIYLAASIISQIIL